MEEHLVQEISCGLSEDVSTMTLEQSEDESSELDEEVPGSTSNVELEQQMFLRTSEQA